MSDHPGYIAVVFFKGDQLDPPSLAALLGVQPDRAYRKGDVRCVQRGTGLEIRAKTGSWYHGTTPTDAGARSIDDHIDFLLDLLEAAGPALTEHIRQNGLDVEIVPFWNEMTDSDAYQFAPERLERGGSASRSTRARTSEDGGRLATAPDGQAEPLPSPAPMACRLTWPAARTAWLRWPAC